MTDFFENMISERLGGKNFGKSTAIYKFELIKRAKAAAKLEKKAAKKQSKLADESAKAQKKKKKKHAVEEIPHTA